MPNDFDDYKVQYLFPCKGQNDSLPDSLIDDQELSYCRNVIPTTAGNGNLIKRLGYTAGTALDGDRITSVYIPQSSTAVVYWVDYDADGTSRIKGNTGGSTSNIQTLTGTTESADWISVGAYDYMCDAGNFYQVTRTGFACAAWTGIPSTTDSICVYNQYVFGVGSSSADLRYTPVSAMTTWDASYALTLTSSTTVDPMECVRQWNDFCVIFTKSRVMFLQGYSYADFSIVRTLYGTGTVRKKSVVPTSQDGLFWWDPARGIARTRDGVTVDYPMIRKLGTTLTTVVSDNAYLHGVWCPDIQAVRYYVSTSDGTVNDLRIDYYPLTDAFFLHDGMGVKACSSDYYATIGSTTNYIGGYVTVSPYIYSQGNTGTTRNDDSANPTGAAITSTVKTKRMTVNGPNCEKHARKVMVTTKLPAAAGNVTYGFYLDNTDTLTNSWTYSASQYLSDYDIAINVQGRKIKHYMSDALDQATEYLTVLEVGSLEKEK